MIKRTFKHQIAHYVGGLPVGKDSFEAAPTLTEGQVYNKIHECEKKGDVKGFMFYGTVYNCITIYDDWWQQLTESL